MIKYVDYFVPDERISCQTIFEESSKKDKLPKEFKTVDEISNFFKSIINIDEIAYSGELDEEKMLCCLLDNFFNKKIVEKDRTLFTI